jgi:DsbC/DsbD-like thiol-disulfide interchange protein
MMCFALGFGDPVPPKVSIPLDPPTDRRPVVAGAAISPAKVRAGDTVTLVVQVKTASKWHIYAADMPTEGSIPTTLKLKLPDGVQAKGKWSYPSAVQNRNGEGWVYEGDLTFRRALTLASDVPAGQIEVTCEFGYQACDPSSCKPPAKLSLKAKVEVAPAQ